MRTFKRDENKSALKDLTPQQAKSGVLISLGFGLTAARENVIFGDECAI